jgi:chromosome segregation ATPase
MNRFLALFVTPICGFSGEIPIFLATAMTVSLTVFSGLCAARNRLPENDVHVVIREMRDGMENMRHEIRNHEAELGMCDERIKNQEIILESIQDQVAASIKATKELLKTSTGDLESKLNSLEATLKGVLTDLRQFKTHANESIAALTHYQEKIEELEKTITEQNENITLLQAAMQSLVEVFQMKDSHSIAGVSAKTYRVKEGDILGEIARQHQTTVKTIKELNGLVNDRIRVGQVLRLRED